MTSNKSFLYAALFVIVLVVCFAMLSAQSANPELYRPNAHVIRLAKGTIIDTQEGKYIALTDERWFSEAQVTALQRENAALNFALNQSRHLRQ